MTTIYTDNGANLNLRTRYFRDGAHGGIEWMYAVDYAAGERRWYGYGAGMGGAQEMTCAKLADVGGPFGGLTRFAPLTEV